MLTLYGIPNCDSCRKARKWLDGMGVSHRFHDLRTDGIDDKRLRAWQKSVDWKTLLNTRSTTWRGLSEKEKTGIDADRAVALMVQYPTLIKRPVLETDRKLLVGFSPEKYAALTQA